MSAFFIFQSNVSDADRFQDYARGVPETLKPFRGEVVLKGKAETIYHGGNRYASGTSPTPTKPWWRTATLQQK